MRGAVGNLPELRDHRAGAHGKDVDLPDGAAELLEEANSFLNEVEGEE